MSHLDRFDIEIIPADGEEKKLLWQSRPQVMKEFFLMRSEGDQLIITNAGTAEEGAEYA